MPNISSTSEAELVVRSTAWQIVRCACDVAELPVTQTLREDVANLVGNMQAFLAQCARCYPVSPCTSDPSERGHRHRLTDAVVTLAARRNRVFQASVAMLKVALKRQTEAENDEGANNRDRIPGGPDGGECRFATCHRGREVDLPGTCQN